jgi:hypothetical protein
VHSLQCVQRKQFLLRNKSRFLVEHFFDLPQSGANLPFWNYSEYTVYRYPVLDYGSAVSDVFICDILAEGFPGAPHLILRSPDSRHAV